MKKLGVFVIFALVVLSGLVLAQSNDSNVTFNDPNLTIDDSNETDGDLNFTESNATNNGTIMPYPDLNSSVGTNLTNGTASNSDDSNESESETEIMVSPNGARVRLFQLERAIRVRILRANEVILFAQNNSIDTSGLEEIVSELEVLADEAHAAALGTNESSKAESLQSFLEIKSESIDLVKEFRDLSKELIPPGERDGLKSKINKINKEEFQEISNQIRAEIKVVNAKRVRDVLGEEGGEEIAEKIESGKLSVVEARNEIKEKIVESGEQKREELRNEIREKVREQKEVNAIEVEQIKVRIQTEVSQRISQQIRDRSINSGSGNSGSRDSDSTNSDSTDSSSNSDSSKKSDRETKDSEDKD